MKDNFHIKEFIMWIWNGELWIENAFLPPSFKGID